MTTEIEVLYRSSHILMKKSVPNTRANRIPGLKQPAAAGPAMAHHGIPADMQNGVSLAAGAHDPT